MPVNYPSNSFEPLTYHFIGMHTTLLDTHLHLYPVYDLPRAFNQLLDRTASAGPEVSRVACMAERHDCQYFREIAEARIALAGFAVEQDQENEIRLVRQKDGLSLTLLPGRQVITREKIEILALAYTEMVVDGQPALDVIYQINQQDGVAVLPWSPGKWFGERGELIKTLITGLENHDFLIGDTTLRPYGWGTPRLMKQAAQLGFGIVAGSDPLPFSGEESWLGAYYTVVESQNAYAATALLKAIKHGDSSLSWQSAGKRSNIINLFDRLKKNAASKKSSA